MPEGPEVKRIVDELNAHIRGTSIVSIISHDKRYSPSGTQLRGQAAEFLKQSRDPNVNLFIGEIKCHGKFIYLRIRGNNSILDQWRVFHTLGMGGGWTVSKKPSKNLCLELVLHNRAKQENFSIYYYDSRRFGTFKFLEGDEGVYALQRKLTKELGPDLLSKKNPVTLATFQSRLKSRKGTWTIAQALMNQAVVAGIGNYLKAEILHEAKISPHRTLESLSLSEIELIYNAAISHIHVRYNTKINSKPYYSFKVYNQRNCGTCGLTTTREKTADKRTTHWCESCVSDSKAISANAEQN